MFSINLHGAGAGDRSIIIYIPLCFLLIVDIDRIDIIRELFTFHYVFY